MLILTDRAILEGISGAIGFILFRRYLTQYLELDPNMELFIAWALVWYFRRFIDNIFKYYKQKYNIKTMNLEF